MHRIDTHNAADVMPTPKAIGTPGYFKDRTFDENGTILDADFLNSLQEELVNVIIFAGLVPDKDDNTQLYAAITSMIDNGVAASFLLESDLDVLTYSITNSTGNDLSFLLSGTLSLNCASINVAGNLIVGDGDPVDAVLNEYDMVSDSDTSIPSLSSIVQYLNTRLSTAPNILQVRGYSLDAPTPGVEAFYSIGAPGIAGDAAYALVMPFAGTISNLIVQMNIAGSGSVATTTFALVKNGTPTVIGGTIASNTSNFSYSGGGSVTVTADDTIQLSIEVDSGSGYYPDKFAFWFELIPS